LGVERKPEAVVPEDLRQVAPAPAEDVEIAAVRVALQLLLDLKRQTLHAATHVGVARRDPHPHPARHRDHDRSAFNVAAITAGGASAPIRTRASFTSTTITPGSDGLAAGGAADTGGDVSTTTGTNPQALAALPASRRHL